MYHFRYQSLWMVNDKFSVEFWKTITWNFKFSKLWIEWWNGSNFMQTILINLKQNNWTKKNIFLEKFKFVKQ